MSIPTCLTRAFAVTLAALAVGLASAETAPAGTYVVRGCNVPGYPSAPLSPWQPAMSPEAAVLDTCMAGGSAGLTFAGIPHMPFVGQASLDLVRPTEGPLSRIAFAGIRFWLQVRLGGSGGPLQVLMHAPGIDGASTSHFIATSPANAAVATPEIPLDPATTAGVQLALTCNIPPGRPAPVARVGAEDCYPADSEPLEVNGIEVRLEENVAPTAKIEGGTALASGPQAGERTMQFSAKDLESGVAKAEVVIGDTVVATRDIGAQCPHVGFAACPESDAGALTFDTRRVANGTHSLTLRVTDAAGNAQIVPAAAPIEIANPAEPAAPAPASAAAPPAQGQARLTARFARSSRSALVVPYGRAVALSGRLSFASARPAARTRISVARRTAASGAREVADGSVLTRADGTFSYRLVARGPSRSIRFVYPAAAGSAVASNPLSIKVRAATRFKVSLRGTTIRFSGRVISGPIPRRGKRLELWGRAPGFAWTRFHTLVTDRRGRFAGRYRLRARRPGVRLQVQVRIPQAKGYPYLSYRSSPRMLRVS